MRRRELSNLNLARTNDGQSRNLQAKNLQSLQVVLQSLALCDCDVAVFSDCYKGLSNQGLITFSPSQGVVSTFVLILSHALALPYTTRQPFHHAQNTFMSQIYHVGRMTATKSTPVDQMVAADALLADSVMDEDGEVRVGVF
jgi:hypothetical protein